MTIAQQRSVHIPMHRLMTAIPDRPHVELPNPPGVNTRGIIDPATPTRRMRRPAPAAPDGKLEKSLRMYRRLPLPLPQPISKGVAFYGSFGVGRRMLPN